MTGTAQGERLSYQTFGEEFLYLLLDPLGFLRVGAVGSSVWEWCAGYEVDALLFDTVLPI